jgi:hypothetical protein
MQLRLQARRVPDAVLLIEQDVVESGQAQDLDDLRAAEKRPAAEHVLAVTQPLLETVLPVHVNSVDALVRVCAVVDCVDSEERDEPDRTRSAVGGTVGCGSNRGAA